MDIHRLGCALAVLLLTGCAQTWQVVYSKRAANAWGLIQAGLRAPNESLSGPQNGGSSLPSTPHAGLLTQWASGG
jgi:hypothetical protein